MVRLSINILKFKGLLRKYLIDKVNDRVIYIKGIVKFYEYVGYKIKFRLNIRYINEIRIKKMYLWLFYSYKDVFFIILFYLKNLGIKLEFCFKIFLFFVII